MVRSLVMLDGNGNSSVVVAALFGSTVWYCSLYSNSNCDSSSEEVNLLC